MSIIDKHFTFLLRITLIYSVHVVYRTHVLLHVFDVDTIIIRYNIVNDLTQHAECRKKLFKQLNMVTYLKLIQMGKVYCWNIHVYICHHIYTRFIFLLHVYKLCVFSIIYLLIISFRSAKVFKHLILLKSLLGSVDYSLHFPVK
jgi:hypothetical protein